MDFNSSNFVKLLIDGLKSKNEDERIRAVFDLFRIVDRELKEVSVQGYVLFLDRICVELLHAYTTGDVWERKGAVMAMSCLTEVDFTCVQSHCRRFAAQLICRSTANDLQLITAEAHLLGQFCTVFHYDFIDDCMKRACESLSSDQPETHKQFSILVLRELAINMPTSFYQQFGSFISAILCALREKNVVTRELASLTLRSALHVAAAREKRYRMGSIPENQMAGLCDSGVNFTSTFQRPGAIQDTEPHVAGLSSVVGWYRNCLVEALRSYGETTTANSSALSSFRAIQQKKLSREEWVHGSMLLLSDLLASVLPNHEKLLNDLNAMSGLSLLDYLTLQQNEASHAVRTVLAPRWSFYDSSVVGTCDFLSSLPYSLTAKQSCLYPSPLSSENPVDRKALDVVSNLCQRVLLENIEQICQTVLSWLKSRNQQLTLLLFKLLPLLAALKSTPSADHEPHQTIVNWLLQCINKEREKPMAIISLSLVGHHIGRAFYDFGWLSQFFSLIRSYLPLSREASSKKRSPPLETAVILSVGVLVKSLGATLHEPVKQILDHLMGSGLNQPLITTLRLISMHIPQLQKEVKDQLLRDLNAALMRTPSGQSHMSPCTGGLIGVLPFPNITTLLSNLGSQCSHKNNISGLPLGVLSSSSGGSLAPQHPPATTGSLGLMSSSIFGANNIRLARRMHHTTGKIYSLRPTDCGIPWANPSSFDFSAVSLPGQSFSSESADTPVIALALKVLSSFSFEGHSLVHFVRHISKNFLSICTCEAKEVRLEAVKTCAHLMLPWVNSVEQMDWLGRSAMHTVADCLDKLLAVGINDPDPDVRRCVFESLDSRFDDYLIQTEHLPSLYLALYDEIFEIRCLVIQRLGRLAELNPACVQPALRKVLLHTINDLAQSGSARNKEQSALLLACLITSAPRFFIPYAEPVLQLLVPRIKSAIPMSWRAILSVPSSPKSQTSLATNVSCSLSDLTHDDLSITRPYQAKTPLDIHGSVNQTHARIAQPVLVGRTSMLSKTKSSNAPVRVDEVSHGFMVHPGAMVSQSCSETLQSCFLSAPSFPINASMTGADISDQWMEPTSVVVALFTTLARLSAVAPTAVRSHMDEFIPVLCSMMLDQSCFPRRLVSVWSLSTLVSNTGYAVLPYRRHPQLLPTLLGLLKREESKEVRQEVLRALGVLGALDPFKYKLYTGQLDTTGDIGIAVSLHEPDEKKDVDIAQSELVVNLSWESRDVFFSVCALSALIHLLRDPTLCNQHANIVRTIVIVLNHLGQRSAHYIRQLMPDYFTCLQASRDARVQEFLIRQLGSIMNTVGLHTKEFANDVVDLLLVHWWTAPNVQNACIRLLSIMSTVLKTEFRPHLARLVPVLLRTLHHESNEPNLIALLEILPQFGYTLEDHVHILVPAIASLIDVNSDANLYSLINSSADVSKNIPGSSDPMMPSQTDSDIGPTDPNMQHLSNDVLDRFQMSQSCNVLSVSSIVGAGVSANSVSPSAVPGGYGLVGSPKLRLCALECLARLSDLVDLDELATQIVHPIYRLMMTLESCLQQLQHVSQHPHILQSAMPNSVSKPFIAQAIQSCTNAINLLHPAAIDVLTGLLHRMGQKFGMLLPLVEKMMNSLHLHPTRFYTILGLIEKGAYMPTSNDRSLSRVTTLATRTYSKRAALSEPDPPPSIQVFDTRGVNLERAWRSPPLMSRDDLDQWLKTLTTTLLRESPNPSIRACSQLMSAAPAIGRILFNAAFVSCWPELTAPQQDALISKLEDVLYMPDQSQEVSQAILNLEEFMAHVDKCSGTSTRVPLPLSLRLLTDRAMKNRAYAKALFYKEQEFLEELEKRSCPSQETLSCLLTIYSKLQLEEAAAGVLLYATRNPQEKLRNEEAWREKLRDWKSALNLYENKLKDERIKDKTNLLLGRMRCLRALGQWSPLNTVVSKYWDKVDDYARIKMAPLACSAAWAMKDWSSVEQYVSILPPDQSFDGSFYRAILDIHRGHYVSALQHITRARNVLDVDLTTMAEESYDRAYADLVNTQLLSEAEEVIQYKLVPERRPVLREAWRSRLEGCQSVVEDWVQIIQLRSLVLQPRDDLKTWLRFADLCCRDGRYDLARQLICDLLGQDPARSPQNEPIPNADPATVFAYTKLLWVTGAHEEAVTRLCVLVTHVLEPLIGSDTLNVGQPRPFAPIFDLAESLDSLDPRNPIAQATLEREELKSLMAKCCLRLGLWYSDLYIRCPPGTDNAHPTHLSSNNIGLQNFVATTNRLFQNRGLSGRPSLGSDSFLHSCGQPTNSNSSRVSGDNEPTRRVPSHPIHLNECVGVNVPHAWEERQGFVIQCYDAATKHAPDNRFAWQSWAMTNYAVFNHLDALKARIESAELELNKVGSQAPTSNSSKSSSPSCTSTSALSPSAQTIADLWHAKTDLQLCMELHAAPSVRGFVNSISLSSSANLQDSLRLINLFFKFGHLSEIREVIREGLTKIRLSNWLLVIQQLLARIDTPREYVASIIVDLLIAVGKSYPQALVYPLVLAFKSGGSDRRRYNANRILYSMEDHSPRLVSEAFLLNEELIRLSITWVEMWSEALEDASRVYFGEKDIMKMFRILHPLHQMMERGHETIHEAAFLQDHGGELSNCRSRCETFEHTSNKLVLQQAWEGYYTLYRQFTKQVNSMSTLELSVASPRLHEYPNDWEISVPGSYEPNRPLVRISGIKNCLSLMTSKQHPRKLTVLGSDGHHYVFLLKGHEDTRQDERVMQFFGLVNTLLTESSETLRRNLTIQRMSVIPLSTNTGLIGWVPNSDTMHSLIRDYREKTQTVLNKENREMIALAPDFERLNIIQKTEVFEAGLRESSGRDLANILWLKSHSSEAWFERRTNFIRSMATMSMVGYILGLGDRHPSNIMLSRETGKVVHIDFGDCFEVAMMREKFPEKVPFRLTRMIIAAMEVTGIDGVYRQTCEMVMSLMRTNRESLLAVLEAFIHDPLLQWVILENRKDFNHNDVKLDDTINPTGQPTVNGANTAVIVNAENGIPGQQLKGVHKPTDQNNVRPYLNLGVQTTTARRPVDRTGGLAPSNVAHLPQLAYEHHIQHQHQPPHKRIVSSKLVFTNPNYPDSISLRDPQKINPWRHHLCNGPWFGCYETAKQLRKQTETGRVTVMRQGLQGFIFSSKPSIDDEKAVEGESKSFTSGNSRARAVMEKIRQKLNGTEREHPMDVARQVDFLIREASSNQNLCQMYIGWCAFW